MTKIIPTVGRICWYTQDESEHWPSIEGQPFAAIVAGVLPSGNVNLDVIDAEGGHHPKLDVTFHEGEEPCPGGHAQWMPYQLGQAAKTEAAEKQASGGTGGIPRPVASEPATAKQDHAMAAKEVAASGGTPSE